MAMGGGASTSEATPYINVTPLIDVLLVLLIIFMVISPQKPHRFEAKSPEKPPEEQKPPVEDPFSLLVIIPDSGDLYKLNTEELKGTDQLYKRLFEVIDKRPPDRKTIFVKAPTTNPYGEVIKVIDVIKKAGGNPIGLQIEGLDN
ncbi:MAG: biopolymer transporter ExbD [Acidobacteria bacterium]|nr:biopolymer transporter ExbD [Acidobacteriota bacterium]MCI0661668.1 biopolymer transporter ExbD [Acidobacteriota bacterium]